MWLAEVGKERIDEIIDPELTIDRALETYSKKGYSWEWINQRLDAIQVRKELTDTWQDHGVKEGREYKDYKGLKKQNLRDNISTTVLIFNMLAEMATKDIANKSNPQGFEEAEEDDFFKEVVDLDEIDDMEETDVDEIEVDKIDETEE